ncbi:MAG: DUF3127 domain-containing protein [Bacteroidota bacterium]|nr:DUF3127 domain-containing protein [Bacteroidota bacterium]MDP4274539.1 DUF3127 domain-containing protein [Bacteroidota bacterium]
MSYEIVGKLIEKEKTIQISEKFRKREFVIEKSENNNGMVFTDSIKFQLTQDRCSLIDPVAINDEIKVTFNIRGNRWEKNGKISYFNNLDAWKIEKMEKEQTPPEMPDFSSEEIPPELEDDLPF